MTSRLRAFGAPLLVIALLAGAIPGWITGGEARGCLLSPAGIAGALLGAAGALLCFRAAALFMRFGESALHPFATPRRLLLQGPYGRSRNPFYLGVILIVLGEAAYWRAGALVLYALGLAIALHAQVVLVEEPRLKRLFGDAYDLYRDRVPRWVPAWRGGSGRAGA